MLIKRLNVKGKLGIDLEFSDRNIVLGENKTGKSTLFKLIVYALGTYVDNFIEEISKHKMCQQVELDIQSKSGMEYKIIRRLPYSDSVIVFKLDKRGQIVEDSMNAYSLDEFSDFLLNEEGYKSQSITYGKDKKATMRYYFLLRAAVVDQDTPSFKILADLGGKSKDYINNQDLIKKAIIEAILDKENEHIQKIRLQLQSLQEDRKMLSARITFINELINEKAIKGEINDFSVVHINEVLRRLEAEKETLIGAKLAACL